MEIIPNFGIIREEISGSGYLAEPDSRGRAAFGYSTEPLGLDARRDNERPTLPLMSVLNDNLLAVAIVRSA